MFTYNNIPESEIAGFRKLNRAHTIYDHNFYAEKNSYSAFSNGDNIIILD